MGKSVSLKKRMEEKKEIQSNNEPDSTIKTIGISLKQHEHNQLRELATLRANSGRGRLSVSAVISDLLNEYGDNYRDKLSS